MKVMVLKHNLITMENILLFLIHVKFIIVFALFCFDEIWLLKRFHVPVKLKVSFSVPLSTMYNGVFRVHGRCTFINIPLSSIIIYFHFLSLFSSPLNPYLLGTIYKIKYNKRKQLKQKKGPTPSFIKNEQLNENKENGDKKTNT